MSSRESSFAELSRRLISETYTPAAVLITSQRECLHFSGPIERYLRLPEEHSTADLCAIVRPEISTTVELAIQQALQNNIRVVIPGQRIGPQRSSISFSIDVKPVINEGEKLLLVCFVDEGPPARQAAGAALHPGSPEAADLERDPCAAGADTEGRDGAGDTQSVRGEGPALRKELKPFSEGHTPFDELQSARAGGRGEITAAELQNILLSMEVATLLLDSNLNIRFFTPAIKSQFRVIPSDIGRPLSDLKSTTSDSELISDAQTVLRYQEPLEREILAQSGAGYMRRIVPYRTPEGRVEGVVITFTDTTERRHAAKALEAAQRQAELANVMRSRFLAAVSHYLRQPLQTLALLQGLLAKKFEGEAARKMVALLDQTLGAMSGMLNTLIDIDQVDAGLVSVETRHFAVNDLLARLRDEFGYHAQVQGLELRVISSSHSIRSDPHLLEQMIRTLLTNALMNTRRGKILLGCRRRGSMLSIEVLDTGVGIPENELQAVFVEVHHYSDIIQDRGRGLGLSTVQRLASLLKLRVSVRSRLGKGSCFAIEVPLLPSETEREEDYRESEPEPAIGEGMRRTGTILVVEDDPVAYELLELFLKEEGHAVATARDEVAALEMVARGSIRPDLILADYNLLNGADGLQITAKFRDKLLRRIPIVILTDDTSADTLRKIALQNCVQLTKPVRAAELSQTIQRLLPLQQSVLEQQTWETGELAAWRETAVRHLSGLTARQHQIMKLVLAGYPSKNIAADLGISRRTVENHRASIMKKTGAKSLPELARLALAAALTEHGEPDRPAPPTIAP
jgi:two-component system CheB/CheR fusion protein